MPDPATPTALLTVSDLVCKRDERLLFKPLSFSLTPGECVELLGANGAGKTTLLRTLAQLHGQFDGAFHSAPFMYQGHRVGLDELLTPVENLQWYAALHGLTVSDAEIQAALAKVGMLAQGLTPCQKLSQGQQRRVCMARWLLNPAKLWILDEPYTALDSAGQVLLNEVLQQHCAEQGAVLAATHVSLTVDGRRAVQLDPLLQNIGMRQSVGQPQTAGLQKEAGA